MPFVHFDVSSGAAGDMLVASLLDAGLSFERWRDALAAVRIPGYAVSVERVVRSGMAALRLRVEEGGHESSSHDHGPEVSAPSPSHGHHAAAHRHGHEQAPGHGDHGAHAASHSHGPHRHLKDLLALAAEASCSERVRDRATRTFRLLAEAEGKVHGRPPEEVHFHEISGVDTMVDVFGAFLALELLGVERVTASPVTTGFGTIHCAHGIFPVPAPATLEILRARGIPFAAGTVEGERLTPTGAAILAVAAESFGPPPPMTVRAVGYGAGSRDFPGVPNVVRAILGAAADVAAESDVVIEFRCAVDDMTPEATAFLLERCFAAGAVEAYAVPAAMKKSRLGAEITALAPPAAADAVEACLFRNGSTFGVRRRETPRRILARTEMRVEAAGRPVRVKVGRYCGEIAAVHPEYDDCRAAAEATGLSFARMAALAEAAARAALGLPDA